MTYFVHEICLLAHHHKRRRGRDRIVVGFTTTYVNSAYHRCEL